MTGPAAPRPPAARLHSAWVVLAVGFLDLFVNYSVRLGYGVVLPEMIGELGFSRTDAGTIFNTYLLGYVTCAPLAGYLTDRFGGRRVIAACAAMLGAGLLLTGTSASLLQASLFFGLAGTGASGLWTPVITVVQRWVTPARRGMALGVLSTGFGLGMAAMGAAFPWVVEHFSWRHAWYFLGAAALAMAAVNAGFLRSDPKDAGTAPWGEPGGTGAAPADPGPPGGLVSLALATRRFWFISLSYFCVSYALFGLSTFMVDYARTGLGLSMERASLLATVHGVGQVAGVLTVLPLSDLLGRRRTIRISNGCIAGGLLGILLAGSSWAAVYVLVGFVAVFHGATFPIYGACAGDFFPRRIMGTVIGALAPFYGAGAMAVHWVTGALRDAHGAYATAFALHAAAGAAGFALFMFVRKEGERGA